MRPHSQLFVVERLPRRQVELSLMPGTFENLPLPRVLPLIDTGRYDQRPGAPRTEGTGPVGAVIEDGVERPLHIEDADLVAVDRHNFARAGREIRDGRDDETSGLHS